MTVTFDGIPLRAISAAVQVAIEAADENADVESLSVKAKETSTVSNSVSRGFPVSISPQH